MNKEELGRCLKLVGVKPQLNFSRSSAQCQWRPRLHVVARTRISLSLGSSICRASYHVETGCIQHLSVFVLIHSVSLYKRTLCLNDDAKVTKKLQIAKQIGNFFAIYILFFLINEHDNYLSLSRASQRLTLLS